MGFFNYLFNFLLFRPLNSYYWVHLNNLIRVRIWFLAIGCLVPVASKSQTLSRFASTLMTHSFSDKRQIMSNVGRSSLWQKSQAVKICLWHDIVLDMTLSVVFMGTCKTWFFFSWHTFRLRAPAVIILLPLTPAVYRTRGSNLYQPQAGVVLSGAGCEGRLLTLLPSSTRVGLCSPPILWSPLFFLVLYHQPSLICRHSTHRSVEDSCFIFLSLSLCLSYLLMCGSVNLHTWLPSQMLISTISSVYQL